MPGVIRGAVSIGTLPFSLSTKFQESHSAQVNSNEYHDGSCQRKSLVTSGRRRWKLSKRLNAFNLGLLRDFYDAAKSSAFYFYSPFETLPPFSHSPIGISGRYLVRFANDWSQTSGMVRADTDIEIVEVASAQDIADASTVTNSAVPASATLFLTSQHIPDSGFTPAFGAGASLSGVGFVFPVPDWFHDTGTWSIRTDTLSIAPNRLLTGSLFVLLMLEHEGSASSALSPGDEFRIYDCYAVVTYGDGSTVTFRPTGTAVDNTSTGATGSVTNPGNAIDSDPSTYASMLCTQYGSFFNGIFLNLNTFRPV